MATLLNQKPIRLAYRQSLLTTPISMVHLRRAFAHIRPRFLLPLHMRHRVLVVSGRRRPRLTHARPNEGIGLGLRGRLAGLSVLSPMKRLKYAVNSNYLYNCVFIVSGRRWSRLAHAWPNQGVGLGLWGRLTGLGVLGPAMSGKNKM